MRYEEKSGKAGKRTTHSHGGHRGRLREKLARFGADSLALHELLEIYLFSALPRVDTNQIAHDLIDKFGSLSAVFEAEVEELKTVEGIGDIAAQQIKLLPAIVRACKMEDYEGKVQFDSLKKAGEFGLSLFHDVTTECAYALLLDNSMRKIDCIKLSNGSIGATNPDLRLFYKEATNKNASAVILYHNHYKGLALPSGSDIDFTHYFEERLADTQMVLVEHIVVAENNFSPIMYRLKGSCRCLARSGITQKTIDTFYN